MKGKKGYYLLVPQGSEENILDADKDDQFPADLLDNYVRAWVEVVVNDSENGFITLPHFFLSGDEEAYYQYEC